MVRRDSFGELVSTFFDYACMSGSSKASTHDNGPSFLLQILSMVFEEANSRNPSRMLMGDQQLCYRRSATQTDDEFHRR